MIVLMAAAALAAAPAARAARPSDGTYTYTIHAGGIEIETDTVVISSTPAAVNVRDAASIPARSVTAVATASYDPSTLVPSAYAADFNLPSGTQHTTVTFEPGTLSVHVPGENVEIRADPAAQLELVADNLAGTSAMIPAVLHAGHANAVTLAVLAGGKTVVCRAGSAQSARPASVPATDRSLSFTCAQLQEIYWYDPATYLVHDIEVPAQNAQIQLTGSTSGVTAPATPQPLATALPTPAAHFSSTDIHFRSNDGIVLSGTLTIPQTARGQVPAVLLVHGSGAEDRNGTIGPNPVFLQLSNALSNAGYAVFRYDKRGVGKSGGNAADTTRDELIADVTAAYEYLRRQPAVDARRVFLLGHSEGGELVPSVAVKNPALAGIVLMAPPALPLGQVIMQQVEDSVPASQRAQARKDETAALQKIRTGHTSGPGMAWLRTSLDVDPILAIQRVRMPILILQGGSDVQVLPQDLPRLVKAAKSSNGDVTARVFPGENHLFMRALPDEPRTPQAALRQYLTVPAYIDSVVLKMLIDWLNAHARI